MFLRSKFLAASAVLVGLALTPVTASATSYSFTLINPPGQSYAFDIRLSPNSGGADSTGFFSFDDPAFGTVNLLWDDNDTTGIFNDDIVRIVGTFGGSLNHTDAGLIDGKWAIDMTYNSAFIAPVGDELFRVESYGSNTGTLTTPDFGSGSVLIPLYDRVAGHLGFSLNFADRIAYLEGDGWLGLGQTSLGTGYADIYLHAVPEPASFALLGLAGLFGIGAKKRVSED